MANLTTVDDLRADALFRAGEPQSSTSTFWVQSLVYLNRVLRDLMLGGQIAVGRDLATSAGIYDHLVSNPINDWWWARARGVLTTAVGRDTDTVTLTLGSTSGTLGATVANSLVGYRIMANQLPTVPLISAHTAGTAAITLDAAWPEVSVAGGQAKLWFDTYTLASDFLRFAAPPYVHSTWSSGISVGCVENRDSEWPLALMPQGPPTQAYLRGPQTLVLNAWDTRAYRLEYEYIAMPPDLVAGAGVTLLPAHYRPVLAVGTAMLICHDKGDDRAQRFASEYREMVGRMIQEHRKMISGGSAVFGQYKVRQGSALRSQQKNGELFLL
mgnify:FL=1